MNHVRIISACAGLILLSVEARADLATVTANLISGSYTAVVNGERVYVGPMSATLTGLQSPVQVWSDNFGRESYFNQPFQVFVSTISSLSDAEVGAAEKRDYEEAAWLMLQYSTNGNAVADLQIAIWYIFDPSGVSLTQGARDWLTRAESAELDGYDFSNIAILTPVPQHQCKPQDKTCKPDSPEFLVIIPHVPGSGQYNSISKTSFPEYPAGDSSPDPPLAHAPEPATILTLGTGLLIGGWILPRRRQATRG